MGDEYENETDNFYFAEEPTTLLGFGHEQLVTDVCRFYESTRSEREDSLNWTMEHNDPPGAYVNWVHNETGETSRCLLIQLGFYSNTTEMFTWHALARELQIEFFTQRYRISETYNIDSSIINSIFANKVKLKREHKHFIPTFVRMLNRALRLVEVVTDDPNMIYYMLTSHSFEDGTNFELFHNVLDNHNLSSNICYTDYCRENAIERIDDDQNVEDDQNEEHVENNEDPETN